MMSNFSFLLGVICLAVATLKIIPEDFLSTEDFVAVLCKLFDGHSSFENFAEWFELEMTRKEDLQMHQSLLASSLFECLDYMSA